MADCMRPSPHSPYVDGPLIARRLQCFDQIACFHMSGLSVRSPMNAGQDGFREESSERMSDLIGGHWGMRKLSRLGSIDHAICSLSCKFWHRLSTVKVELLPCLADLYQTSLKRYPTPYSVSIMSKLPSTSLNFLRTRLMWLSMVRSSTWISAP